MNSTDRTRLSTKDARAGRKTSYMPWILGLSLGGAVILAIFAITVFAT